MIIAVIPCFNEEKNIAEVVTSTLEYVDMVLVSDGQSTDRTIEFASKVGADTLVAPPGFITGYGASIRRGIDRIKEKESPDIIVILDGDGQHDPDDLPSLLEPVLNNEADVVMGCRMLGDAMPGYRRFGNKVLTAMCNFNSEFKPPDAVTGYWVVRAEAMPYLTEKKWGMAIELLIKTRNRWRMKAVPVKAIYHDNYEDNSSTSPLRLGAALLWYILKWRTKVEIIGEW